MRTVLIVDDNVTLAYFTARNLQRDIADLEVVTSSSCSEARIAAAKKAPSVIIVDYKLQDGDGYELIREISSADPDMASILISGEAVPERVLNGDLFGFLLKPYEAEALLSLVNSALTDRKPPARSSENAPLAECEGYDRHLVQNRLAGLLAGIRALGADVRFHANDPKCVSEVLDEYLDRLCDVVVEVSQMLPRCPANKKPEA
jgi:DNA-binding NtrC family response regulator